MIKQTQDFNFDNSLLTNFTENLDAEETIKNDFFNPKGCNYRLFYNNDKLEISIINADFREEKEDDKFLKEISREFKKLFNSDKQ